MSFPITPNDIFAQTNGGLDIILRYYPQAEPAVQRKNYKFRIRDEKSDPSPSAVLAAYNGVYKVKDFGTGDRPMDAIAVVMREERLEFWDAVKQIVSDFQLIMPDNDNRPLNRPEIRKRDAEPGEEEGYTWVKKEFTKRELQSVFAHGTWTYLSKRRNTKHDVFGDELAMVNALETCGKYNFISLASYKKVKDGKVTITSSTETFPIFMFDEGTWQKFYKPMEQNQSYRFFSIGKKPEHYVFGLKQAEERLKKIRKEDPDETIDDEGDKGDKKEGDEKLDKLNEIIICTGGSDALNVAAFGYEVVWFNSETVKPQNVPYLKLRSMAYTVYNLPDVDASGIAAGRELGLTYLDIHTIWLPEELKRFGSGKGKPCKDVRDYLSLYSSEDFRNLIKLALMFRFWDEEPKKDRSGKIQYKFNRIQYEFKPNNRRLYNFLYHSGFGKLAMPNAKDGEVLVQLKDNVVTLVQFRDVRKYIEQFLEERYASEDLFNAFYKSDQVSDSSLQNLKTLSIDFKACDWDYQMLFFQNETWKITAAGIEVIPVANTRQKVWSDKVIPHRVKKHKEPPFVITRKRGTGAYQTGDLDIQFNHTDCLFTRYLIQTSRMYWRQELEERLPGHKQEYQLEYMKKYAYSLEGELLTEEERAEQKQHFIAKLCSIGYLLHRHKEPAQAYCVWGMDYTMTVGQSYGGTGKSICYDSLKHLMRQVALQGRDEKLTDRQFLFSGVTEHTDYIYVDDAHQYFNFSYFYSIITGQMEAERKGLDKWVLDFSKSPKLCITSNFTLRETDSATMRRVWYTCFSDYYHKNPNGEYLQDRSPKDELGKTLFADFDPADWNNYLNFVAGCIQSWMQWGKIEPPMQTVKENTYKSKMGATFHSWADVFFAADSGNLNAYVQRTHAFDLFKREYDPKCTAQSFLSKLDYWCKFNHYVLNPRELWTDKRANRITRREFKKEFKNGQWVISEEKAVIECLYIQTPDVPLQEPVKESPKPELPAADGFNKPTGKDIPF